MQGCVWILRVCIIGWLELDGLRERLQLKLSGNCNPDLAGWKFRIGRIESDEEKNFDGDVPPNYADINSGQSGRVGDITADQMIKHFEIPDDELASRVGAGENPPFTWRKCLYLEWYSNHNGRVVIQSTRLEVERIGERAFELTDEYWQEQRRYNEQEMNYFMTQLGNALNRDSPD